MGDLNMTAKESIAGFRELVLGAADVQKCIKCKCMGRTLETVKRELRKLPGDEPKELLTDVQRFLDLMEKSEYN